MNRRHVVLVALLLLVFAAVLRGERLFAVGYSGAPMVAVAYDPSEMRANGALHDAWEAALSRQGVPHQWIAEGDLSVLGADHVAEHYPVVLLPDGLARWVSDGLAAELISYANRGGTLLVVADAGTRTDDGHVLNESVFGNLLQKDALKSNVEYYQSSAASLMISGHPEAIDQAVARAQAAIAAARRNQVAENASK